MMGTLTLQGLTGMHIAGNQLINNYRKFLLAYERQHRPRDLPAPPVSEARPWLASRKDVLQADASGAQWGSSHAFRVREAHC